MRVHPYVVVDGRLHRNERFMEPSIPDTREEAVAAYRAWTESLNRRATLQEHLLRVRDDVESEVEERTQEISGAHERLRDFASALSHDLREPIRMVSKFRALLEERDGDRLSEDGREFLAFARNGAQRLGRMTAS